MPAAAPPNPGSLRHQIAIQAHSSSPDAYGQPVQTWTTIATAWAAITLLTAKEQYASGQLAAQSSHAIMLRFPPAAVKAGMRVTYGSHVYRIQGVNNLEQRNTWLQLFVLEIEDTE